MEYSIGEQHSKKNPISYQANFSYHIFLPLRNYIILPTCSNRQLSGGPPLIPLTDCFHRTFKFKRRFAPPNAVAFSPPLFLEQRTRTRRHLSAEWRTFPRQLREKKKKRRTSCLVKVWKRAIDAAATNLEKGETFTCVLKTWTWLDGCTQTCVDGWSALLPCEQYKEGKQVPKMMVSFVFVFSRLKEKVRVCWTSIGYAMKAIFAACGIEGKTNKSKF